MCSLKVAPSKAETALLEPFMGLTLERIYVPTTKTEFSSATAEIMGAGVVGFDTESKPTFVTGEVSEGPHVVQFALPDKAFIFQLHQADCCPFVIGLLESEALLKVGFGLKSDGAQIRAKLGADLKALLDLNHLFNRDGYHNSMGVRAAVGMVLKQKFPKSKKITTSNWAQPQLNSQQLLYAANDAYAALRVLQALNRPYEDLPITGLTVRSNY